MCLATRADGPGRMEHEIATQRDDAGNDVVEQKMGDETRIVRRVVDENDVAAAQFERRPAGELDGEPPVEPVLDRPGVVGVARATVGRRRAECCIQSDAVGDVGLASL